LGLACNTENTKRKELEAKGRYHRGVLALDEGKVGVAEREFRVVLEMDPTHGGARNKLASVLIEKSHQQSDRRSVLVGEAISLLKKSIELDQGSTWARKELARLYRHNGYLKEALQLCEELVALNSKDVQGYICLAQVAEED